MCVISVCHNTAWYNLSLYPRDASTTRSPLEQLAGKHSLRCSGGKGRNVQKSVFPVGEMRTTVKPVRIHRAMSSGL